MFWAHSWTVFLSVQLSLCKTATLKKTKIVFKTNFRLMQVESIAECSKVPLEHSAIFLTCIKLPFVITIFVLSSFEWLFYTDFTVPTANILVEKK